MSKLLLISTALLLFSSCFNEARYNLKSGNVFSNVEDFKIIKIKELKGVSGTSSFNKVNTGLVASVELPPLLSEDGINLYNRKKVD
jgi:hypothetical protein